MSNFNASNFYAECKELFQAYANAFDYAPQGIEEVPDLKPKRELFVATLLGDKALSEACHDDSTIYYYNVIRYCLTAGIEYGAQWQLKPEGFEEKGYDQILYKNNVGRSSDDIVTAISPTPQMWRQFLIGLHRVWGKQLEPYLTGSNAEASKEQSEAVYQSCFALFQLGVAIALDKFDAPEEAEQEDGDSDSIATAAPDAAPNDAAAPNAAAPDAAAHHEAE